jgi:hypothetical protein
MTNPILGLFTALLERMFELFRDLGISILAKGLKIRMPVDVVLSMALHVFTAKMLPVFREHETSADEKPLGIILLDGPWPVLPAEVSANARVVATVFGPDARYGLTVRVAADLYIEVSICLVRWVRSRAAYK